MSTTIVLAREAFADALNTVEDVNVSPYGPISAPVTGDGWVTVGRVAPVDYTRSSIVLTAVVVLGSDPRAAEELLDTWAVDILDAVTTADFPSADVSIEPIILTVDGGPGLSALTVTITTEVEP